MKSCLTSWRLKCQFISTNRDTRISNSSNPRTKLHLFHGCARFSSLLILAITNTFSMKEMTFITFILSLTVQQALYYLFSKTLLTFRLKPETILESWILLDQLKKTTLKPMNGIQKSKFWKDSLQLKQRVMLKFSIFLFLVCIRCNRSLLMRTMSYLTKVSNVLDKHGCSS